MIPKNFPLTEVDLESRRRHALAKVYRLLIQLAEQAENETVLPNLHSDKQEETNQAH